MLCDYTCGECSLLDSGSCSKCIGVAPSLQALTYNNISLVQSRQLNSNATEERRNYNIRIIVKTIYKYIFRLPDMHLVSTGLRHPPL